MTIDAIDVISDRLEDGWLEADDLAEIVAIDLLGKLMEAAGVEDGGHLVITRSADWPLRRLKLIERAGWANGIVQNLTSKERPEGTIPMYRVVAP